MSLDPLDWLIIAAYFALSLLIGLRYTRRAGGSTDEYFLGGRSIPWWLAGVSIVATTFSSDTPLLVAGLTARGGVAGNWVWWSFALSGMLTVFLFARLWRRAGVVTDVELTAIRYSGRAADALRIFKALYFGIPINAIIGGSVTLGMVKILSGTLGIDETLAILILFVSTALYSTLGGFLGVVWTDFFQFFLAMVGSVALAYFSVGAVGGLEAIPEGLDAATGGAGADVLDLFPRADSAFLPLVSLAVFFTVQWWAVWYPGAEPGGGGFVAQRMFAAKDERAALLATLAFNVIHYTLRPWPWILTALAAMVYYAGDPAVAADPESGYVRLIADVLPAGWRGVLVAAMMAAYMSTVSTLLNWGASYVVNDVYRPYLAKTASEREYVLASRITSVVIMALVGVVALVLEQVIQVLDVLLSIGAGTGLVLILRWYWWRVNAWSEISAMTAAAGISLTVRYVVGPGAFGLTDHPHDAQTFLAYTLVITTALVTVVWLSVTLLTRPTDERVLVSFYRRTRPGGAGWRPVARLAPEVVAPVALGVKLLDWALGCALVYLTLLGVGEVLLGSPLRGTVLLTLTVATGAWLLARLRNEPDDTVSPRGEPAKQPTRLEVVG